MNVERSTVGTKKCRQPKCQKSLKLVQSRQSLTTVRQSSLILLFDGRVTNCPFTEHLQMDTLNEDSPLIFGLQGVDTQNYMRLR